jgi:hypothetical protein
MLARVHCVHSHSLRLRRSELVLLHDLLRFWGAADELGGSINHGCKHGGKAGIGLPWKSLHGSQDAVQKRHWGNGAVVEQTDAHAWAGTHVPLQQHSMRLLGGRTLLEIGRQALLHELNVAEGKPFG